MCNNNTNDVHWLYSTPLSPAIAYNSQHRIKYLQLLFHSSLESSFNCIFGVLLVYCFFYSHLLHVRCRLFLPHTISVARQEHVNTLRSSEQIHLISALIAQVAISIYSVSVDGKNYVIKGKSMYFDNLIPIFFMIAIKQYT